MQRPVPGSENLTDEELIAFLDQPPSLGDKGFDAVAHVKEFIREHNIERGKDCVTGAIIWELYNQWSKKQYKVKTFFFEQFHKRFRRKEHNFNIYYRLNKEPFEAIAVTHRCTCCKQVLYGTEYQAQKKEERERKDRFKYIQEKANQTKKI